MTDQDQNNGVSEVWLGVFLIGDESRKAQRSEVTYGGPVWCLCVWNEPVERSRATRSRSADVLFGQKSQNLSFLPGSRGHMTPFLRRRRGGLRAVFVARLQDGGHVTQQALVFGKEGGWCLSGKLGAFLTPPVPKTWRSWRAAASTIRGRGLR